jgi:hypothetical protein
MSAIFDPTQECQAVNALPPLDIDAAAQTTDWLNLKNATAVFYYVQLGVTGAASTLTVEEATSSAGASNTAIAFSYRAEETDAGDTLGNWTAATTSGFAMSTNDNVMYVIRVLASDLSDGSPYVALQLTDPGAATFGSVLALTTGLRYPQNVPPTAIT